MTTQTTQTQMSSTASMARGMARVAADVVRSNAVPSFPAVQRAATAEDRWSRTEPVQTESRLRLVPQPTDAQVDAHAEAQAYAQADQDAAMTAFFSHPVVIRIASLAAATVIVGAAFLPVLMQAAQIMR